MKKIILICIFTFITINVLAADYILCYVIPNKSEAAVVQEISDMIEKKKIKTTNVDLKKGHFVFKCTNDGICDTLDVFKINNYLFVANQCPFSIKCDGLNIIDYIKALKYTQNVYITKAEIKHYTDIKKENSTTIPSQTYDYNRLKADTKLNELSLQVLKTNNINDKIAWNEYALYMDKNQLIDWDSLNVTKEQSCNALLGMYVQKYFYTKDQVILNKAIKLTDSQIQNETKNIDFLKEATGIALYTKDKKRIIKYYEHLCSVDDNSCKELSGLVANKIQEIDNIHQQKVQNVANTTGAIVGFLLKSAVYLQAASISAPKSNMNCIRTGNIINCTSW